MITKKIIKAHKKYNGDIDAWSRSLWSKNTSKYEDWYLITSLIQDIHLVSEKKASSDFERTLVQRIEDNCDTDETLEILLELAGSKKWW